MCFEVCLVTHVLGRMEVGWTDWVRAPGEENSTGDGTCLKVPSSMSQWSLGPDPPGRRGCTCLLWSWGWLFGSSASFSHWTWGGQAVMGSVREQPPAL